MVGWMVAFGLRTPIFAIVSSVLELNPYICEWSTLFVGASAEELIRLTLLSTLNLRDDFGAVYWLGLGWAGMETFYYIGQSLIYSRWLSEDDYHAVTTVGILEIDEEVVGATDSRVPKDPKTSVTTELALASDDEEEAQVEDDDVPLREVRHLLGIDRPWWSLMGRTSSMMVHLGLSSWLGYAGWKLLVPAATVHAAIYVLWGVFTPGRWTVPAASYCTLMASMAIFLIGLALYGQIV
jgi:hypothetical protein